MKLSAVTVTVTVPVTAALWMLAGAARGAPRDLSNEFVVPEGLTVTLWAEAPLLYKPTNIDVDERGRIWVAEGVNYRTFRGRDSAQPEAIPFRHPEGDRIVILEDTDGDGSADTSKVFVQDKDLVAPLGVAVIGRRVFVSCSPHLLVYTLDSSGDHPARKEIFLTGFGGHDHDHGLHSVVAGPDGGLYFNAGNAGPHRVTDRDGKTVRAGSVYTGGSPYNTTNTPNLRSDDGRVWTGGLALRVDAEGRHLTALAHNFRNSYEVAIDSFGDLWQSDNDDEVRACRTSWVMEGGNMGFFSANGTRTWRADQRPGQPLPIAQWHQEDPGVVPAGDIYGAGGPTGVAVYEGGLLPARFHGMILNCDAGRNTVFGHLPHPAGAGFRLERTIFLSSQRGSTEGYQWDKVSLADRRTWFRPSDVVVGTDGAVYVADWFDPVVGGHAMRSTNGYGRILRVAPAGSPARAPRLDLSTASGQIAALRNPAINVRFAVRELLAADARAAQPLLEELSRSENPVFRARAAWFSGRWERALRDRDDRVRVAAWRAVRREWQSRPRDLLALAAGCARDASPALRREVALALREFSLPQAGDILVALAAGYDGQDRYYLEALGLGCDGKEAALYPMLWSALGAPDPRNWSGAFADLVWRLHPVAAVPDVAARARAVSLPASRRRQAMDTLAFVPDRAAAEAMLELAHNGPADTRAAALWWARFRAGNEWQAFDVASRLPARVDTAAEQQRQARMQALRRTLLDTNAAPVQRQRAAVSMAETEAGGVALLALAGRGQLPREFYEPVAEAIFRNPAPGVRALATQYFQRPTRGGAPFPPLAELLTRRGDPARGRQVFQGEAAGCVKCHAVAGAGGDLGPDLATARTKLGREGIFDAILNPSAVIAAGYEPWLIETEEGEIYSGCIVSDGDIVTLKEAAGVTRSIPSRDIASRQRQKLSLMPDNITAGLTAGELVDLVEYLMSEVAAPGP